MYRGFEVEGATLPVNPPLNDVVRYLTHLQSYVVPSENRTLVVVSTDSVPATYGERTWGEMIRALVRVCHKPGDDEYYADCRLQPELPNSPSRAKYKMPRLQVVRLLLGRWPGAGGGTPRSVIDVTKSTYTHPQIFADDLTSSDIPGFPFAWWQLLVAEVTAAALAGHIYPHLVEANATT